MKNYHCSGLLRRKLLAMTGVRRGFTLLELCITLSLISVLILLSTAAFFDIRNYQKTSYIIQALNKTISYARLEAVINKTTITISSVNNNWQNGWLIKQDNKILKNYPSMPFEIINKKIEIVITPDGRTEGYNSKFKINNKIYLVINRAGRTKTEPII